MKASIVALVSVLSACNASQIQGASSTDSQASGQKTSADGTIIGPPSTAPLSVCIPTSVTNKRYHTTYALSCQKMELYTPKDGMTTPSGFVYMCNNNQMDSASFGLIQEALADVFMPYGTKPDMGDYRVATEGWIGQFKNVQGPVNALLVFTEDPNVTITGMCQ